MIFWITDFSPGMKPSAHAMVGLKKALTGLQDLTALRETAKYLTGMMLLTDKSINVGFLAYRIEI